MALAGVLEPTCATEISVRPEAWAELTVLSAVAHGQRVNQGTTLVKFDTQKIDLAIVDLEADMMARYAARLLEFKDL